MACFKAVRTKLSHSGDKNTQTSKSGCFKNILLVKQRFINRILTLKQAFCLNNYWFSFVLLLLPLIDFCEHFCFLLLILGVSCCFLYVSFWYFAWEIGAQPVRITPLTQAWCLTDVLCSTRYKLPAKNTRSWKNHVYCYQYGKSKYVRCYFCFTSSSHDLECSSALP